MLRSEPVERINLYIRKQYLIDSVRTIGECGIIQIDQLNNHKNPENMLCSDKLVYIDKISQRVEYCRLRISKITEIIDESKNYKEIKKQINRNYKQIVKLETEKQYLEHKKKDLEENYIMASKSLYFFKHELNNFSSIHFKFTIAMIDREKKFLTRKTIKQRLRRNVYLQMYDVDLKYSPKQRTLLILYAIGDDSIKMIKQIIETFNGRIYDCEIDRDNISCNKITEKYKSNTGTTDTNNTDTNNTSTNNTGTNNTGTNNTGTNNGSNNTDSNNTGTNNGSTNNGSNNTDSNNTDSNNTGTNNGSTNNGSNNTDSNNTDSNNTGTNNDSNNTGSVKSLSILLDSSNLTKSQYNKISDSNLNKDSNEKYNHPIKKYIREIEKSFVIIEKQTKRVEKRLKKYLKKISAEYLTWKYHVNKQRLLYKTMNNFVSSESGTSFTGKGWILRDKLNQFAKMREIGDGKYFTFEITKTEEQPPSYFKTNTITEAFQNLTNVFGVPKYGEINPAIFMLFTFPFMFGAMFGDILHGLLLGLTAALMIVFFDRLNHRCGVLQIVLEGRYVVLTCAIAAIWFGFLYGDFGSLPVALFKSQFETGRTYPFGIDPIWHQAVNKTVFVNSVKMKLSLILGFVHMTLGAVIAIKNAIYFRDKITLFCTAIPQFIVFVLFLGYLVFLCIYKWLITATRPSLVNTLIAMYTSPFNIPDQMYPNQIYVQLFIVAIIIFCIPWMLLSRPIYLIVRRQVPCGQMLDLWINSAIHVVEFGLSLISNTSSYLRLWAVSLAHVQLTSVLHQFTIGNSRFLISFFLFPVYLLFTSLLLIGLEGLSACLHALRLNWIEFFSKFYTGGGIAFNPLSFKLRDDEIYDD